MITTIRKIALLGILALVISGCGEGALKATDFFPDINGVWIAQTDMVLVSNSCTLSLPSEFDANGEKLNISQDRQTPSRIFVGGNQGKLQPDGSFVTRETVQQDNYYEYPEGVTTLRYRWEGKFDGHNLHVEYIIEIIPPADPQCNAVYELEANRTAGG